MVVSGLRLGLSPSDLVSMPNTRLANMLDAACDAGARGDGGGGRVVRDATQADINAILK